MAYKFQVGAARLSGSTTFEEAVTVASLDAGSGGISNAGAIAGATTLSASGQVDLPGAVRFGANNYTTIAAASGILSSSATATLHNMTLDRATIASVDVNGGAIDNTPIGAGTQAAGQFTTLSASSTLDVEGVSSFGPGGAMTISAAGVLSGSGLSTLHNLTLDQATIVSVDIDGGAIDNTPIGAGTQAAGQFTTLSASSTVDLPGAVRFGAENYTTVAAASGILSSSATATLHKVDLDRVIVGADEVGDLTGPGLGVTSNTLGVNLDTLDAANVNVANDSIVFMDQDDSNLSRKESIADLISAVAGAGLAANSGVLSVSSNDVAVILDGGSLSEGYNFMTGALPSGGISVTLPSGSAGDVVIVKAKDGTFNDSNKLTINRSGSQTIDGETSIAIESPFGAVTCVYVTDNDWRIV